VAVVGRGRPSAQNGVLAGHGDLCLDCCANRSDDCDEAALAGARAANQQMSVFKNGTYYHYEFFLDGRPLPRLHRYC